VSSFIASCVQTKTSGQRSLYSVHSPLLQRRVGFVKNPKGEKVTSGGRKVFSADCVNAVRSGMTDCDIERWAEIRMRTAFAERWQRLKRCSPTFLLTQLRKTITT